MVNLRHYLGTGLYIVCGTVELPNKVEEYHAFVYDSNFSEWEGKRYHGAIIDNRKHSYLRAFSHEDLIENMIVLLLRKFKSLFMAHVSFKY